MSSATGMDPRIEARRLEVQRAVGRRRTRVALGVGTVLAAVGAAWLVVRSPLLDVDAIRVETTAHVPAEAVVLASGIRAGDALAFLDTGAAARAVERLPWVDRVSVGREWPGTVRITVTEHRPVLAVRGGGAVALVASDGRAFARVRAVPPGVRELRGSGRLPDPGELAVAPEVAAALTDLPAPLGSRVVAVAVADTGTDLLLTGGGEVRLGSADDLAAKTAAAAAVLRAEPSACIRYLDVSAPDAPVRRSC